jgi:hypothetical protein
MHGGGRAELSLEGAQQVTLRWGRGEAQSVEMGCLVLIHQAPH